MYPSAATRTALLLACALSWPANAQVQTDMQGRMLERYVEALTICLRGRTEVEISAGRRDRDQLATRTIAFCGPGYVRAVVQHKLTNRQEAEATVQVLAYRTADRQLSGGPPISDR